MNKLLTLCLILGICLSTSAQNIGIGVDPPEDLLHVKGGDIRIEHPSFPRLTLFQGATHSAALEMNGSNLWLSNQLAGNLYLRTNNLPRVTINSVGDVGIGTTSPSYRLHIVDGNLRLDGNSHFIDINSTDSMLLNGIRLYDHGVFRGGFFYNTIVNHVNLTNNANVSGFIADLAANRFGIGTQTPQQLFDVSGKIAIGDDGVAASEGALRYNSSEQSFQGYDGSSWVDFGGGHWSKTGNTVYYNDGTVLVGRTNTIGSERFGVRYPVTGPSYGGMYIETNGDPGSLPFYGYAIDNTAKMWHYYDGATGDWRVYNAGNRFTVENSGDVGIGTTNPESPLHIVSGNNWDLTATEGDLKIGDNGYRLVMGVATGGGGAGTARIYAKGGTEKIVLGGGTTDAMAILPNGRVGIGLNTPVHALHVYRPNANYNVMFESGNGSPDLVLDHSTNSTNTSVIRFQSEGSFRGSVGYDPDDEYIFMYEGGNILIGQNGRLGVGIVPNVNYKLSVDGKIIGEEVKVQLSQNWPDYVFDEGYQLPELDELRRHIDRYGHLPGMPSAEKIELEEGFEVGEMNRILVEKVEELTLYILNQDERIRELEARLMQSDH